MPIKLHQLSASTPKSLAIPFGDAVLNIDYKPTAVTPNLEAREAERKAQGIVMTGVAEFLAEIITSWDLVDDKGKPIPPTRDTLMGFGMDVLGVISKAIQEDLVPNPPAPNGSSSSG